MRIERCDGCKYWVADIDQNYYEGLGECRRYAPRASHGSFEFELLQALTTVAWAHATEEQKERDFMQWEEAWRGSSAWPNTAADDWCGEWQRGKEGVG